MDKKFSLTLTDRKASGFLAMLTLICFLPLVDKAFNIDEPMYIWAARHIRQNPLDFYGFMVNWDGISQPMSELMQNPPLSSYYLALLAGFFGWNESLLHSGFVVTGMAVIWGTYRLARDMSYTPLQGLFAALVVFCTPAYFILANYVTCDMSMLAAWIWAVILWRRAMLADDFRLYLLSSLLISVAALTKYFGIALIPLLLVYSLAVRRRAGIWVLALLVPAGVLLAYQLITINLYGKGLLSGAAMYATGLRIGSGLIPKTLAGFAFVGGGLVSVIFSMLAVTDRRGAISGLVSSVMLLVLLLIGQDSVLALYSRSSAGYLIQTAVMATAGAGLMVLAIMSMWRKRDADSLLLLCWIIGTFVFTCYVNWTISARNILPMAPAAGLLLAGRIAVDDETGSFKWSDSWAVVSLVPALLVSILVARADYHHAGSARKAAGMMMQDLSGLQRNIWFQGHWGFQYYMELLEARPFDIRNSTVGAGDIMIIPGNNSNTAALADELSSMLRSYSYSSVCCLTTMNAGVGAGFYSDDWGGLPFVFGPAPEESYRVYLLH
ncbi:MAG: glycosyltransferase family 39 protein [Geobacteraceae bacterium]|nr:glycosyltransferase family 39 protein [Geobacteraceae bacterium]